LGSPAEAPALELRGNHAVPQYRADIDGLRALAVVPVVFWHFGIPRFSGGFVGVDVFFVISGFLITSLIRAEMKAGTFSIAYFYERRIRRIFPALFAVLLLSAVLGLLLLFPTDLKRFAESLQATVVFGSNFVFHNLAGYWDVASERKPLLHTWSLAVEEQFYLLFPLTLLLLTRAGRRAEMAGIASILLVSFILNLWAVRADPIADFFLLPYRAWELMLGSLLAVARFPGPQNRLMREAIMAAGLLLVLAAVFYYTPDTPFPGAAAVVPCLGAALLIYCGGSGITLVGSALQCRPAVFTGLISYSLYLWHWPLLVFARYALFRQLSPGETWFLIGISVVCAIVSWRLIEQPFRGRAERFSRKQVFAFGATVSAGALVAGAILQLHGGLPSRFSPKVQAILAAGSADQSPRRYGCVGPPKHWDADATECRFGAPARAPSLLLWGDSHASVLLPVLAQLAMERGQAGYFATHHSCAPLLGVQVSRADGCEAFNARILAEAMRDPNIRTVILAGHWAKMAEGTAYQHDDAGTSFLTDRQTRLRSLDKNPEVFARGLTRTIAALAKAHKDVVLVASIPEVGWPVPETMARLALGHSSQDIRPTAAAFQARQRHVLPLVQRLQRIYGISVVYPDTVLCRTGRCEVSEDGVPIYVDAHHLSYRGALLLKPLLKAPIDRSY